MAKDGVAVEARLAGLVARFVGGERMNVTAECSELGIAPKTFYKYVGRFRVEGVDGFFPRSRRPNSSPTSTSVHVQDAIVRARKQLADDGLDSGATSIGWWLADHRDQWQRAGDRVPSRATINRVLGDRGLLTSYPKRRPRRSGHRFTRSQRNELWQLDAYEHRLAGGGKVVVVEIVDDHTRTLLAAHAGPAENAETVWAAFTAAATRYGLPQDLLTDNHTALNGSRRGFTTDLEAAARALGVNPIASSVAHPQTCGKVERVHLTSQRRLAAQPAAADLDELNDQLETWRTIYNNVRRHQSLDGLTPSQAWATAPASGPYGEPLAAPLQVTTPSVSPAGCIRVDGIEIGIGRRHHGQHTTVFRSGDDVSVFADRKLIKELVIDRTRRYQPNR